MVTNQQSQIHEYLKRDQDTIETYYIFLSGSDNHKAAELQKK